MQKCSLRGVLSLWSKQIVRLSLHVHMSEFSVLLCHVVTRYMAPEVLSSSVTPASDVWSAGVMAFQLLTGRLPFDDHRNPFAPSISAVWRSVLCDQVDYNMPWWRGISDDAKDFVDSLLQR